MQYITLVILFIVTTSVNKAEHCGIDSKKWELIFRARAGNGEKVMPAFLGTYSKCPSARGSCRMQDGCFHDTIDPTAILLLKKEPKQHLRSRIIDYWVNANIKMVKLALFKDGEEVAYITFNGLGSNKRNWFTHSRIVGSSWCDVTTSGKYNIFSITGYENERTFHINNVYNSCPGDKGWLVVSEGRVWCDMDRHKNYPQFLYARNGTVTKWNLKGTIASANHTGNVTYDITFNEAAQLN